MNDRVVKSEQFELYELSEQMLQLHIKNLYNKDSENNDLESKDVEETESRVKALNIHLKS